MKLHTHLLFSFSIHLCSCTVYDYILTVAVCAFDIQAQLYMPAVYHTVIRHLHLPAPESYQRLQKPLCLPVTKMIDLPDDAGHFNAAV